MPTEMNIINFDCSSLQHAQIGYDMHRGNALDLMLNTSNAKQCTHHLPYAYIEAPVKIGGEELKGIKLASPAENKEVTTGIPLLHIHLNPLVTPTKMSLIIYVSPEDNSAIQKAKFAGQLQSERELQCGEIKIFNLDQTKEPGEISWIDYVTIPSFKTNLAITQTDQSIDMTPFNATEDNTVKAWNLMLDPPQEAVTVEQNFGDGVKNALEWRASTASK